MSNLQFVSLVQDASNLQSQPSSHGKESLALNSIKENFNSRFKTHPATMDLFVGALAFVYELEPVPTDEDPFNRSRRSTRDPQPITEQQLEPEKLLEHRTRTTGKEKVKVNEYCTRWKDYGPEYDTWIREASYLSLWCR
jgi:hypothetical protein